MLLFGIVAGNLMILAAMAGLYHNGIHEKTEHLKGTGITKMYFGYILLGLTLLVTGYDWSL